MPFTIIVGGFFGDEGKGKIIAYLAKKDNLSIAVRGGVGPNAGHTFTFEGKTYKVRMLPSAALNVSTKLLVGAGVLIDVETLLKEIQIFTAHDRTFVDSQCGIIEKVHIAKDIPALSLYIENVSNFVNYALDKKENIIIEGTQGTFLSLYHGEYPYVTSKDICASGICSDVGIGPKRVEEVLVVFKAYVTRVGAGPLQNEVDNEQVHKLGWVEFGSVTGRQRRASPFNMNLAKKAITLNSATQLAVTKLDVVFPESAGLREFAKLPEKPRRFIENIEAETGLRVTLIGTGADLNDIIDRRE